MGAKRTSIEVELLVGLTDFVVIVLHLVESSLNHFLDKGHGASALPVSTDEWFSSSFHMC